MNREDYERYSRDAEERDQDRDHRRFLADTYNDGDSCFSQPRPRQQRQQPPPPLLKDRQTQDFGCMLHYDEGKPPTRHLPDNPGTREYIRRLSHAAQLHVQLPNGSRWTVECSEWTRIDDPAETHRRQEKARRESLGDE